MKLKSTLLTKILVTIIVLILTSNSSFAQDGSSCTAAIAINPSLQVQSFNLGIGGKLWFYHTDTSTINIMECFDPNHIQRITQIDVYNDCSSNQALQSISFDSLSQLGERQISVVGSKLVCVSYLVPSTDV